MISRIILENTLPSVFDDMRQSAHIVASQVWLREVELTKPDNYMIYAESGTGKSSLCSFIYGARRDYTGRILFDGEDVRDYSPAKWSELRKRSLAYLPQQLSLFPELTAFENIEIKNRLTGFKTRKDILDMLDVMGIPEKADVRAQYLSIGQQQRVAIVRALCQPFDFLLLDEPVSHLDARNNSIVASIIAQAARQQGASIIATSVGNNISLPDFTALNL